MQRRSSANSSERCGPRSCCNGATAVLEIGVVLRYNKEGQRTLNGDGAGTQREVESGQPPLPNHRHRRSDSQSFRERAFGTRPGRAYARHMRRARAQRRCDTLAAQDASWPLFPQAVNVSVDAASSSQPTPTLSSLPANGHGTVHHAAGTMHEPAGPQQQAAREA